MVIASISPSLVHVLEWVGRFHVLVIHIPIAMFMGGAVAESWSILHRRTAVVSPVVRFCVFCGSLGAVAAVSLGLPHASLGGFDDSPSRTLSIHRWLGIVASVIAIGALALSELDSRRGSRSLAFRILLFTAAGMIGVAAHFGGLVSHGDDYFKW